MKAPLLLTALLLGGTAAPALATSAAQHAATGQQTVVVSCYRGPWDDVIWDRPQAAFTDSLVAVGYSYERALAIGERVCRDASLVNNPDGLRETTRQILRTAPRQ